MDPVTINLSGLNELAGQYGPYGYLIAYVLITAFLGINVRRHIRLSGVTQGDIQVAHVARAIVAGIIGAIMFFVTLDSGNDMFNRSIRITKLEQHNDSFVQYHKGRADEARQNLADVREELAQVKQDCSSFTTQLGQQAVEKVACATEEGQ